MAKFERIARLYMGIVIHVAIVFLMVMMLLEWRCHG